MSKPKEINRGALFRAAKRLMVDAQTYIECAGNITRLAGGGEDELLEIGNSFLHVRRALARLSEVCDLFPRAEVPSELRKPEQKAGA